MATYWLQNGPSGLADLTGRWTADYEVRVYDNISRALTDWLPMHEAGPGRWQTGPLTFHGQHIVDLRIAGDQVERYTMELQRRRPIELVLLPPNAPGRLPAHPNGPAKVPNRPIDTESQSG